MNAILEMYHKHLIDELEHMDKNFFLLAVLT